MLQLLTSDYARHLIYQIRSCGSTVDILAYIVNCNLYKKSDNANLIFIELKKFVTQGKTVRVVFDYPKLHKPNYNPNKFFTRRFKEAGFSVRYLHSGTTQHAKLLIFDSKFIVFGSHNLTTRSVVSRHDISLITDNPSLLSTLISYYNSIWSSSIEA